VTPRQWRDAIRDSDLDATAKLVAYTLSTYLNGRGEAWPSKETLAAGASKSKRAVDGAIDRIAATGFLSVSKSKGRSSNRYQATTPTVQAVAPSTVQTGAPLARSNRAASSTPTLQPLTANRAAIDTATLQVAAPESEAEVESEVEVEVEARPDPAVWTCEEPLKHGELCGSTFKSEAALERHRTEAHWLPSSLAADLLPELPT
jgi:hypothetical protein